MMTSGRMVLLLVLAAWACLAMAATYPTAYKDPAGATRNLRAEFQYKVNAEYTLEGEEPVSAGFIVDYAWEAREKALPPLNGVPTLSYELLKGRQQGKATGAMAAEMAEEEANFDDAMDPFTVEYQRAPSGEIAGMKCVKGELPYSGEKMSFAGALADAILFSFPFEGGLAFPAAAAEVGDNWRQTETIELPVPAPVGEADAPTLELTEEYTVKEIQRINNVDYLVITGSFSGKRTSALHEWEVGGGNIASALVGGAVEGKVTYLFDPAAGTVYRLAADFTAAIDMRREGITGKITETLAIKMERTDTGKK